MNFEFGTNIVSLHFVILYKHICQNFAFENFWPLPTLNLDFVSTEIKTIPMWEWVHLVTKTKKYGT